MSQSGGFRRALGTLAIALAGLAPADGHPLDERFVRYEAQALLLTGGLRLDVWVLHGGLSAEAAWNRHDRERDRILSPAEQTTWARELLAELRLEVAGRRRAVTPEAFDFPDWAAFRACERPLIIRAAVELTPPAGPVDCRLTVAPQRAWPILARVVFVAPAAVRLEQPTRGPGWAAVRATWPAAGAEVDTRLPRHTPPEWLYTLPGALAPDISPVAPTDRTPLADLPSSRAVEAPSPWPAVGLLILATWSVRAVSKNRGRPRR